MKLHKLISRTVLATALLGATFGGVFSGTKVSADDSTSPNNGGELFSTLKGKQIKQIKFSDGDTKNVGDSDNIGDSSYINKNTNYPLGGAFVSYTGNNQNFQSLKSNDISDAGNSLSSAIPAQDNEHLNNTITANSNDSSSYGSNYSGTQADITSGLLTLNAVPNFNFGNNDSNDSGNNQDHRQLHLMNTDPTHSNTMGENTQDGNSDNLLSVSDYRQVHQNNAGGWAVNAKLSNFQPIDGTSDSQYTSSNQDSQWMIKLTKSTLSSNYHGNNYNRYDSSNNNNDNHTGNSGPTVFNDATLPSDNNSTSTFMNTKNNYTNGHGTTNVSYGTNDISLTTPYNVQPGKYMATITWTLSSNPTSVNN